MRNGWRRGAGLRIGRIVLGMLALEVLAMEVPGSSAAVAQNLAANGDFRSDTVGWDLFLGTQLLWTNLTEEGDCAASGSGLVSSQPGSGVHFAVITQCITLHDEPNIFAEARHQGYGTFTLRLDFTTTFNCTTGFLTWANGAQVQDPVTWKTLRLSGIPPSNANAVLVTLRAEDSEPHGLLVDGVIVASRRAIFLDGFEGNDAGEVAPCRWGGQL